MLKHAKEDNAYGLIYYYPVQHHVIPSLPYSEKPDIRDCSDSSPNIATSSSSGSSSSITAVIQHSSSSISPESIHLRSICKISISISIFNFNINWKPTNLHINTCVHIHTYLFICMNMCIYVFIKRNIKRE